MRRKNTHKIPIYKTFATIFQKKVQRTAKSGPLYHIYASICILEVGVDAAPL